MVNLTNILIKSRRTLSEKLFEVISDYDIYCELIGAEVEIGDFIHSPIRSDKKPTFRLFVPADKEVVFFKDFAWVGGDVFTFVRLFALYQEGIALNSRFQIIKYLDIRLSLGLFGSNPGKGKFTKRKVDHNFYISKSIIKFKSREFTKRDLRYWKSFFITEHILKLFDVRSVHKLLNAEGEVIHSVGTTTLTFAFVIYDKIKLYSPEADKEFKWRNTCPSDYYQGLQQILTLKSVNTTLIWTKALKDVMVFYAFIGHKYDILAPHGESYKPKDRFLQMLFKKYTRIIVIYDFDRAGVAGANALRKRDPRFEVKFVSTKRVLVDGSLTVVNKDISDFAEYRSKTEVNERIKQMGL